MTCYLTFFSGKPLAVNIFSAGLIPLVDGVWTDTTSLFGEALDNAKFDQGMMVGSKVRILISVGRFMIHCSL